MATSSKARQKASSSHSTAASPRTARRALSSSRALLEKDSRYNTGKSKPDRYASSSNKKTSKHSNARSGRNRNNDESDDAESTPDEDSDHEERKKRSQLKKQKAQLRAQSPDEDLYQSSSSESGSSSDSVQVVIASKRQSTTKSLKSRAVSVESKRGRLSPVKTASNKPKTRPSPVPKRSVTGPSRLGSDSVSPPPLRVVAPSSGSRPKARPSASHKLASPGFHSRSRRRDSPPAPQRSSHNAATVSRREEERPRGRPALHSPPKRIKANVLPVESDSSDAAPKQSVPTKKLAAPAPSPARSSNLINKRKAPSPSDTDSSGTGIPPPPKRTVSDRLTNQGRPGPSIQQSKRRAPTPTDSSSDAAEAPSIRKAIPQSRLELPARPRAVPAVPAVNRAPSPSDSDSESDVQPVAVVRQTIVVEERIRTVDKQSMNYGNQTRPSNPPRPVIEIPRAGKKYTAKHPSYSPAIVASLSPPAKAHVSASSKSPAEPIRLKPVVDRQAEVDYDLKIQSGLSDVKAERIRPKPVVHRRIEAELEFLEVARSESRSPSEPYVGTSAQIYIEQRHARQTIRNPSPITSRPTLLAQESQRVVSSEESEEVHMPRSSSPDQRSVKQPSPKRSPFQVRRRIPSPVQSSDGEDSQDESVPAHNASSLRARETTAITRQITSTSEPESRPRYEAVVEAKTRMLEDQYEKKPFPRLSRSSSDEEDSAGEETAINSVPTISQRRSTPERNHRQMDRREEYLERPLPGESSVPVNEALFEQDLPAFEARAVEEDLPSMQGDEHPAAEVESMEEEIPVPAYISRSISKSPRLHRDEEPRFTATSRIISQPIRSKKKRQRDRYTDAVPVPYDAEDRQSNDSGEERYSDAKSNPGSPPLQVKQERLSLSKRARKVTGGISAVSRQPTTRRRTRTRKSNRADEDTGGSASESDTFGDNGAIVSDSTANSGHSDSEKRRRTSEMEKPRVRELKSGTNPDSDFVDSGMLRKRRSVPATKTEPINRPSVDRRSSSVALKLNKPSRPSKSAARSSNTRPFFEAGVEPRRKSLNERFSGEDTESSDNVEVMKSSTLEAGQSADAVLRAMSRESRQRSEQSDTGAQSRKGGGREVYEDELSNEEDVRKDARMMAQDDPDSDDALPLLRRGPYDSAKASRTSDISQNQGRSNRTTDDYEDMPLDILDSYTQNNAFSSPPPVTHDGHANVFASVVGTDAEDHNDEDDRGIRTDTKSHHEASSDLLQPPQPAGPPSAAAEVELEAEIQVSAVSEKGRPVPEQPYLAFHFGNLPREVLEAVHSATSSDSHQQASSSSKRRTGPTPVNGKRRQRIVEAKDDEEDEVIVQDSAFVRDPHGRMMRKEEMIRILAEHEASSKGKGKARASSLEDAEVSIVDEAELAAQAALAKKDRLHASASQSFHFDTNIEPGSVRYDDMADDDQNFDISIARFEVQVDEILEEDDIMQGGSSALEIIEGIVEDFEEDFWEDEVELFIVEQLLHRHHRRKTTRLSTTQAEAREQIMSPATHHGDHETLESSLLSEPIELVTVPALDESSMSNHSDVQQTLASVPDAVASDSTGAPTPHSEPPATAAPMSPDIEIPTTPYRTIPRGSPSKVSPTKHRNAESAYILHSAQSQPERILESAQSDDGKSNKHDQPVAVQSKQIREKESIAQRQKDTTGGSWLPTISHSILHEALIPGQISQEEFIPGSVRSERAVTPQQPSASTASQTPNSEHGRNRRQNNVYVEIQSPPKASPARKGHDQRRITASAPVLPDSPRRNPEVGDAHIQEKQSPGRGFIPHMNSSEALQDHAIPAALGENEVELPDRQSVRPRGSSYVDEINAMVEEELAEIAEALSEPEITAPTQSLPNVTAAPATASVDADMATENENGFLVTATAALGEADAGSTNTEARGEEILEIVTTTTVEVTETSTQQTVDEVQSVESIRAQVPPVETTVAPSSSSGSDAPSEHGVRASSAQATVAEPSERNASASAVESSSSSSESTGSTDSESSEEGDDAEGEVFLEDPEKRFSLTDLLSWADSLKDQERPHLITSLGAKKLFDQMKLSTDGALPLLLAWKLESRTKAECVKADLISLLRENELDSPGKLATYLIALQTTTLAMSSHLRFPSTSEDDTDSQPVRTWRIPEAYRSFYEFSFDYARDTIDSESIAQDQARNLWWIILAPCLSRGQDIVDFLDSGDWKGEITREAWQGLLDACASGDRLISKYHSGDIASGQDLVAAFRTWLLRKEDKSAVAENGEEVLSATGLQQ